MVMRANWQWTVLRLKRRGPLPRGKHLIKTPSFSLSQKDQEQTNSVS